MFFGRRVDCLVEMYAAGIAAAHPRMSTKKIVDRAEQLAEEVEKRRKAREKKEEAKREREERKREKLREEYRKAEQRNPEVLYKAQNEFRVRYAERKKVRARDLC